MKKLLTILFIFSSFSLMAGVDPEVFIRGEVSGSFSEKEVRVVDSYGQKYYLPRSVFPEDFKMKQGARFAINVPEKVVSKIKILK
ncbi:MAG TPA: hypothetical protein VKZ84_02520 [Bacteriovoracaceae bacterium]|nr:hypothetical protein [Bacteriovoracaceae bacterium]